MKFVFAYIKPFKKKNEPCFRDVKSTLSLKFFKKSFIVSLILNIINLRVGSVSRPPTLVDFKNKRRI